MMGEGYIMFWARILVSMATHSSNKLTKGKHETILFLRNHNTQSFNILCVEMHTPLYKSCQPCPWGPYRLRPRASLPAIGFQWEIHEKFFSETKRPKASVFGMQHCYMELKINPAKHAHVARNDPISVFISFHSLIIRQNIKKSSSQKPHGPEHLYFMCSYV